MKNINKTILSDRKKRRHEGRRNVDSASSNIFFVRIFRTLTVGFCFCGRTFHWLKNFSSEFDNPDR